MEKCTLYGAGLALCANPSQKLAGLQYAKLKTASYLTTHENVIANNLSGSPAVRRRRIAFAGTSTIIKAMKLLPILLLVAVLQVTAKSHAQNVTLSMKSVTLDKVFMALSKQTGYSIVYTKEMIDGKAKVNVYAANEQLKNVLDACLKNSGLTYSITDKIVIIKDALLNSSNSPANFYTIRRHPQVVHDVHIHVIDSAGQPLEGASVMVKGTTQGGSTDVNGNISLSNLENGALLTVSYVGYATKEITIDNDNIFNVVLQPGVSPLDQVLIQAYGKTSQRLTTGSITTVKSEDIEKQPVDNPLYALQGRVPGLIINPTSGLPGAAVNLQLRGDNSINFNTSPLIVIDGLPITNNVAELSGGRSMNGYGLSTLSFINPNDIESISVLKDADATSIYGSRGANGVILITTKKGSYGDTRIDLNLQTGWAKDPKFLDLMNTQQYLNYRQTGFANAGIDFKNTFPFNDPTTKYWYAPELNFWSQTDNTDWQKVLLGGTAHYNDIQGSISGGSQTVQFRIGGNFHRQSEVFPGSSIDEKGTFISSISGNSRNRKFKVGITTSYTIDKNTLPGGNFTQLALTLQPNAPALYNADGTLNWADSPLGYTSWVNGGNPLATLVNQYKSDIKNLVATGNISYQILKSLSIEAAVGYNEFRGEGFNPSYIAANDPASITINTTANATNSQTVSKNFNFDPNLTYNAQFGKSRLNIILGGTYQMQNTSLQSINASGFLQDALVHNFSAATGYFAYNSSADYKYAGAFSRVEYNYNNKYLLNLSGRRDGSSRFGPGNQFGNFGSAGAGWIFSEEVFIKDHLPFLSFGKLRASYGTAGNDGIADYQYFQKYNVNGGGTNTYQGAIGLTTTGNFNSAYHWETTKKFEVGLETGFLKDRIFLIADYYRNHSGNQLIQESQPSTAGIGVPYVNFPALVQNSGVEFTLKTDNIKGQKFLWSSGLTFAHNGNKLIAFPGLAESYYSYQLKIGQPVSGLVRAYNLKGVDPATGIYQFITYDSQENGITVSPHPPKIQK